MPDNKIEDLKNYFADRIDKIITTEEQEITLSKSINSSIPYDVAWLYHKPGMSRQDAMDVFQDDITSWARENGYRVNEGNNVILPDFNKTDVNIAVTEAILQHSADWDLEHNSKIIHNKSQQGNDKFYEQVTVNFLMSDQSEIESNIKKFYDGKEQVEFIIDYNRATRYKDAQFLTDALKKNPEIFSEIPALKDIYVEKLEALTTELQDYETETPKFKKYKEDRSSNQLPKEEIFDISEYQNDLKNSLEKAQSLDFGDKTANISTDESIQIKQKLENIYKTLKQEGINFDYSLTDNKGKSDEIKTSIGNFNVTFSDEKLKNIQNNESGKSRN